MGYLAEGCIQAVELLVKGDPETYSAICTTIKISSLSISASLLIGVPAGFLLGWCTFPGKKILRIVVDTLLAIPTVAVGLIVYALISRAGPLGGLGLLFTVPGVAIAQTVLVIPIVVSLTATAIENLDRRFIPTIQTLGAQGKQIAFASVSEARYAVLAAAVTAYGRAVSEVGISMMIGGNIKWRTRTITSAIALETGKGEFAMGVALGMVLLFVSFLANWSLILLKRRI